MNKKKILFAMLIVMAMALCGAFLIDVPSVFATETINYETIENEAGTFSGQGYYVIGDTATLTAEMNDGYEFDAWVSVDAEGNAIAVLSTELEYTFVVERNINIQATWHKKVYAVEFAMDLLDAQTGELKDFSSSIVNADDIDGAYYYDDELTITLNVKNGKYIYDLAKSNIYINNIPLSNLPNFNTTITNNPQTGFSTFSITLNIREDIRINVDYVRMYNFQIKSGNDIDISELIGLISVGENDYYSAIDAYNYIVREDGEINLSILDGNNVYKFVRHKFQNEEYSDNAKPTFRLSGNSEFIVEYSKKGYDVTFASYITNSYGEYDLMPNQLYNIPAFKLNAGESITFEYDADTKNITIKEAEYVYPADTYGYRFVGFAVNGELLDSNSYTLSTTDPTSVEIQIIFEYIQYMLQLRLVDEYFSDDVDSGFSYVDCTQLVKGSRIRLFATSSKYVIKGWSFVANPNENDYLSSNEIVFEPTSDREEDRVHTLYLDVDYSYYSVEYKLSDTNIEQGDSQGAYVYYAQLQAGIVESIVLTNNADNVTIALNGTIYTDSASTSDQTIQTITTTITYDDTINAYKVDDFHYDIYIYMTEDGTEYSHIVLRDITYNYDGANDKFVLTHATINAPEAPQYNVTKNSRYSINFTNLLPNSLIVYDTISTDNTNYLFTTFKDKTGNNLWSFDYLDGRRCILKATSYDQVITEYRKLSNDINLNITNESAYEYSYVAFSVDGGAVSSGNKIVAMNGQVIEISINPDQIAKGYQFNGYYLNGVLLSSENQIEIVMANSYINQTIDINFSEIEYIININYIDNAANAIPQENANGILNLAGLTGGITSLRVTISGEYNLVATANLGYYVADAYLGAKAYQLNGLIGNNLSNETNTAWKLSVINFEEAIINNASIDTCEVNLYINFTRHTYSVKVYFEIDENAGSITYPSLYMNNIKYPVSKVTEEINGIPTTRYLAMAEGFEYNSNINLRLESFMIGTGLQKWQDIAGNQLTTQLEYGVVAINSNIVVTAVLQYISYSVEFAIVDEEGNSCRYGRVISANNSVKMFDTINYMVDPNIGYVLKEKYAYNANNEKFVDNIDSGKLIFNPANFKIEEGHKFKIYFAFGLKGVELSISNIVEGGLFHFKEQDPSTLATYVIQRTRDNSTLTLTDETGYGVQTNDIITLQINLASIGIDLTYVKLGNTIITTESTNPYNLSISNVYEEDKLVGIYYNLRIEFAPSVINALEDIVNLQNVLRVRTYNVVYTYNFINYNFGITLIRNYNRVTEYSEEDEALEIPDVGFGSTVQFSYVYEGMNSEIGNKFKVNGFTVAGIKQNATESYTMEGIELWEQISLTKYVEANNTINVVLTLVPKITLINSTIYSPESGYLYEREYIGTNQGLITLGENPDVLVGGNFQVIVTYDTGAGFSDAKPINVGEYPVRIIAQITSESSQPITVEFDEPVTYKITPASITIGFKTFSATNPVTKTYDGTSKISSQILIDDFALNGMFVSDKTKVFVDKTRLSASLSGTIVNTAETLYDISVFDIFLLDESNNTVTNYVLSSGQNLVFTRIAQILPKPLHIIGFKASNKVYNGETDVVVDVSGIEYVGKLESDSTQILTDKLNFYLENSSVGYRRKVLLNWTDALVGADSTNYSVTYDEKTIDIYPYELDRYVDGYGTFKVVDVDRLCLIPIESELLVNAYIKGSSEYRALYSRVEKEMSRGEKLKVCYDIVLRIGVVNQLVPQGLYIYLPKIKNTTKAIQVVNDNSVEIVDHASQKGYTVVKVDKGDAVFAVVTKTIYLPLWLIILIIALSILLIIIIVIIFIAIRRKRQNKYSAYDKI